MLVVDASHIVVCRCPCGAGGKGGRTGVIDGPQITTNTGIKDEHLLGAAFIAFIAVKLK